MALVWENSLFHPPSRFLIESSDLLERVAVDPDFMDTITFIAGRIAKAFQDGNKLLICGNGGSAADAQHMAAELLSRFKMERNPLPAIALTTDTSVITAIGNDYGFDHVFARQVSGLGRPGDILLAISTSGKSQNVLIALGAARVAGLTTIGFTGAHADMERFCDRVLSAPSLETALIQQIHLVAYHCICGLVERELFGQPREPK